MDDDAIIELLFARSDRAISELDRKYRRRCLKLSYSILSSQQDAEECVNDAYLGIWHAIPPERPDPLWAYLCKIVRNISITRFHANTAAKRDSRYAVALDELESCLASKHTVDTELDESELIRTIEDFLEKLSVENRVIFMRRYAYADAYSERAARVRLSENNVAVRLNRIRRKMKQYLIERNVFI